MVTVGMFEWLAESAQFSLHAPNVERDQEASCLVFVGVCCVCTCFWSSPRFNCIAHCSLYAGTIELPDSGVCVCIGSDDAGGRQSPSCSHVRFCFAILPPSLMSSVAQSDKVIPLISLRLAETTNGEMDVVLTPTNGARSINFTAVEEQFTDPRYSYATGRIKLYGSVYLADDCAYPGNDIVSFDCRRRCWRYCLVSL